jgi:hypothetical protein
MELSMFHAACRLVALTCLVLIQAGVARAESAALPPSTPAASTATNEGFSVGWSVHRFQDDFAIGASISTPSMVARTLRITAGGGVAWYPHARTSGGDETWKTYGHTRLVLEAGRRIQDTPLRLYGFGGPTLLFVDNLSTDQVSAGGVGGFGFEFFMPKAGRDGPVSYRIELGGIGTSGRADRQAGAPIFANGLLISAAMHFYP